MKLFFSLLLAGCIMFSPQTKMTYSKVNKYDFKKILAGTWRASNTKCLIEYTFTNNLKFSFFNTCAHREKATGIAVVINNNSFSLKHGSKKIFGAIYNGKYFVVKYDKNTEYIFKKWK